MSTLTDPTTLDIVNYPHPALRWESKSVKRVDGELKAIIARMFELMYAAHGIGLAANQVDLPLRLFVLNLKSDPEEGEELVFINPVLSRPKGNEEGEEGCLSFPKLYGPVRRPARIHVSAYSLAGEQIELDLDGLYARAVQHEFDHLDGILFPDRMSETSRLAVADVLQDFETEFESRCRLGQIPPTQDIETRLRDLEARYC